MENNCSTVTSSGSPTVAYFLSNLSTTFAIALAIAVSFTIATISLTGRQLYLARKLVSCRTRCLHFCILYSTFAFVSLCCLCAMISLRSAFLAHLLCLLYLTCSLSVLSSLLLVLLDGVDSMLKSCMETSSHFSLRVPPFCCLCIFLPNLDISEKKLRVLKWMIFQAPIVRVVVTVISIFLILELQTKSVWVLKLLDALSAPSILLAIFGVHILAKMTAKNMVLAPYRFIVIFRCMDATLAIYGLHQFIFEIVAYFGVFACGPILSVTDTATFWKNLFIIGEMFLLTTLATILLGPGKSKIFDKHSTWNAENNSEVSLSGKEV